MSAEVLDGKVNVEQVGELTFGVGHIGGQLSQEEAAKEAKALADHTAETTVRTTAGCGDGRRTLELAYGTQGDALDDRVEPQLFGGLDLAATKAAVAANSPIVRDATNIWEAYLAVSRYLQEQGYEGGGHKGCGASATVKSSVELQIAPEKLAPAVQALVPGDDVPALLATIEANKRAKLTQGFYDGWDPARHEQHLAAHFPQNFATLDARHDHALHGHEERTIYAITKPGSGLAKNAFIRDTGHQAFGLTPWMAEEIAPLFGTTDQERRLFLVALADDTWHVGAGLTASGTPILVAS